jgi:hypothetical protein
MNPHKNWLRKLIRAFVILVAVIVLPVMSFNILVDPLWLFSHENKWNDIQQGFNERQQKVNTLTYSDQSVDALLLGSSRSTYVNQHEFDDLNVYNLAVSSMLVEEYNGYIEYAERKKGEEFDYIFLGLDFFATNKYRAEPKRPPSYYIENANSYMYRFKSIASIDTFKKSLIDFRSSLANEPVFTDHRYYSRKNVAKPFEAPLDLVKKRVETNLYEHYKNREKYEYDPSIKTMLEQLKQNNPHTKFIVYTTPVTFPRMAVELQQDSYWEGYSQWLKDLVTIFGEVNHYMTVNDVTMNLDHFIDSHHFKPAIGSKIVDDIWNKEEKKEQHFGTTLTAKNIDDSLQKTKQTIEKHKDKRFTYLEPPESKPVFKLGEGNLPNSRASQLSTSSAPFEIIGLREDFQLSNQRSSLLIKPHGNETEKSLIQLGIDGSDFLPSSQEVTVIVTLKGNVAKDGALQLFIQDEVNKKWERVNYNTVLSPSQSRAFKISKEIRKDSSSILFGVKWEGISKDSEWIEIEDIDVYVH